MPYKMNYKINQHELGALKGLPYLPRLAYLEAIRPYMDFATGIVGLKRGISYQSLREELYIEPHTGYTQSGSPSKQQLRRAMQTLARAGLVSIQSADKKLILKCELASQDNCEQNKPGTNPAHQPNTNATRKSIFQTTDYDSNVKKAGTHTQTQPGIPPETGINIVFLEHAFEKFWLMYPNKHSKLQARNIFESLSPSPELFETMLNALQKQCEYYNQAITTGQWVPNWKNAANWLAQHCWNETLFQTSHMRNKHASTAKHHTTDSHAGNLLWESCKDAFDAEYDEYHTSDVIDFKQYRKNAR